MTYFTNISMVRAWTSNLSTRRFMARGKCATINVSRTAGTADLATPSVTITSTVTSRACELLLPFSNVLTTNIESPDSPGSYKIESTSSHRTGFLIPTKTANAHVLGQSTQLTGAKAVSGTKKSASPSTSISAKGAIKKRDNKDVSVDARKSIRTGDTNGLFNRSSTSIVDAILSPEPKQNVRRTDLQLHLSVFSITTTSGRNMQQWGLGTGTSSTAEGSTNPIERYASSMHLMIPKYRKPNRSDPFDHFWTNWWFPRKIPTSM